MKIGIVGNIEKKSVADAIILLLELQKKFPLEFFLHSELRALFKKRKDIRIPSNNFCKADELCDSSDMIIAFGGDGTMLKAARLVRNSGVPIAGINLGKLGFLAEVSPNAMELFIQEILQNNHRIEERSLLQVQIAEKRESIIALNEITIDKNGSSRSIYISVYVDNDYLVSFSGDGIIISTPTGSTAYALAAGGPIVVPTTDVFVLQPISPHSLSARTVIVPDAKKIRVTVERIFDEARVTADGQQVSTVKSPMDIFIHKADYTIKLAKPRESNYYDTLRAKLLWGSDVRILRGKE